MKDKKDKTLRKSLYSELIEKEYGSPVVRAKRKKLFIESGREVTGLFDPMKIQRMTPDQMVDAIENKRVSRYINPVFKRVLCGSSKLQRHDNLAKATAVNAFQEKMRRLNPFKEA